MVAEQSSAESVVLVESVWVDSDQTDGCSNAIQGWKNVELGYLPNGSQADVVFSNKLLERFYSTTRTHFSHKSQFRKVFIQEKNRQWDIKKRKDNIEKQFAFLRSDNPAAVGKRLGFSYKLYPGLHLLTSNFVKNRCFKINKTIITKN